MKEQIEKLRQIEKEYDELIGRLEQHRQSNYSLINQLERRQAKVIEYRLVLESRLWGVDT